MRNMNCRTIRREIEEVGPGRMLSRAAISHLSTCPACETLSRQQTNLRAIVSSLGKVEAPADFDYRLRARLAAEKARGGRSFLVGNLSFGLRSAAVVAMLLLVGAAFIFVSFRSRPDTQLAGGREVTPKPVATADAGPKQAPAAVAPKQDDAAPIQATLHPTNRPQKGIGTRNQLATVRGPKRIGTQDESLRAAQVDQLAESYPTAPFAINASYQSLKVSVDDQRGAMRTISLPSVSFGSQRTLSQNSSPLLASSRGDW